MRIGMSLTSNYPGTESAQAVTNVLERARVAADAGVAHLSLGDHHATGANNSYVQNVPVIARIMAEWPADRSLGLLFLLPLWNPVLAAEQIGTLAAMSAADGADSPPPFFVQTGIGSGQAQFSAMGAKLSDRGDRIDEAIRVIKELLAGETASSSRFGLVDASIAPRPVGPVEWWIGAGVGRRPLERAASNGDAWYVTPGLELAQLAEAAVRYGQRCDHHGTTPKLAVRRDVFIADDDAEALRRGGDLVSAGYRGMSEKVLIFGGVARVADRLGELAELGVDDVVIRTMAVDQASALRSIELLADVRHQLGQS